MMGFPIVDAHLHVWDPGLLSYPWLEDVPLLNKPHLMNDYDAACGPVQVEKMVFVQAECDFAQYKQEADWVASLAGEDPRIEGIVAWAPLEKGESVRGELEALAENRLVKGIRRIIEFEDDPGFCLRPDFVRGARALTDCDFSFDICVKHHPLENTIRFVRQCPDVRFILDHIGKPDIKNRLFTPWKAQIETLAAMPNVWCKMSGLVSEADQASWTREDLKPYIDHVIESFGIERVMYGGDWPVAVLATKYPRWVRTLRWALEGLSEQERRQVFRDNAIAFYRLEGAR